MDVKELKYRKQELELSIASKLSTLISDFRNETGISPSYISINMVQVYDCGQTPEHIIAGVSVDLDI